MRFRIRQLQKLWDGFGTSMVKELKLIAGAQEARNDSRYWSVWVAANYHSGTREIDDARIILMTAVVEGKK